MARAKKATVRYIGPGRGVVRRVVGKNVWSPDNDYLCDVPSGEAQGLLDNGDFEIANDEQPEIKPAQSNEEGA